MLPVLTLVSDLLMNQGNTPLLLLVIGTALHHLGQLTLFHSKALFGLTVEMRHICFYSLTIDIEMWTAVIQPQGLVSIQSTLRDVCFILCEDRNVILPGRVLAERDAFNVMALWYLSVELHPYKTHLWEFQTVPGNVYIAFNLVGCVRLTG